MKTAILLSNLGTPKSPYPKDVKTYLKEFLMDEGVINLPYILRWLLVHGIILNTRPKKSSKAYQKIWMKNGSPLMVYTTQFASQLQTLLGDEFLVEVSMRYQEPSISSALEKIKKEKIKEIIFIPLYPQYSEATTGSTIEKFLKEYHKLQMTIPFKIIKNFYNTSQYVEAMVNTTQEILNKTEYDHLLFSYHGLPEDHLKKKYKECLASLECCDQINPDKNECYRAQCLKTTSLIAKRLNLKKNKYSITFQSRLGRAKWISPYTDQTLMQLPQSGVKKIAVICPSFISDCLETLEEIQITGKELFIENGGEKFTLIPCLNDHSIWVNKFSELIQKSVQTQSAHQSEPALI